MWPSFARAILLAEPSYGMLKKEAGSSSTDTVDYETMDIETMKSSFLDATKYNLLVSKVKSMHEQFVKMFDAMEPSEDGTAPKMNYSEQIVTRMLEKCDEYSTEIEQLKDEKASLFKTLLEKAHRYANNKKAQKKAPGFIQIMRDKKGELDGDFQKLSIANEENRKKWLTMQKFFAGEIKPKDPKKIVRPPPPVQHIDSTSVDHSELNRLMAEVELGKEADARKKKK